MTDTTTAGTPAITAGDRIAELAGALQAIMDFYLANPEVPMPYSIRTTHLSLRSRAELDALAGEFDQPPPPPADNYRGAQFSVHLEHDPIKVVMLFSFHEDRQ